MSPISPHDVNSIKFDVARSTAIQSYAVLEREVAAIMRALIGCDPKTGDIIFYRISSTRARYSIVSDLMKSWKDGKHRKAWERLEKWLIPLDSKRNRLVHWIRQVDVFDEKVGIVTSCLVNGLDGLNPRVDLVTKITIGRLSPSHTELTQGAESA